MTGIPTHGFFGFQWHLTDRCNLRCSHCYQDQHSGASELPLCDLKSIASTISAAMPGREISISLTGGEPLLLPHLLGLMEHLHTLPNISTLDIISNGTVVDDALLHALGRLPRLRQIKLSLEGPDAASNDAIRGPGAFDSLCENLPRIAASTNRPILLMMTLGHHNAAYIDAMIHKADQLGASGIVFERLVPLGVGQALRQQVLKRHEWQTAKAVIAEAAGLADVDLSPYTALWLELDSAGQRDLRGAQCDLGPESMALMPDGTAYPCRRLPIALGNLLRDDFSSIEKKLQSLGPIGHGQCRALIASYKKSMLNRYGAE